MISSKPTVLVAMSGGVDSSVVAGLLKQRGYDVVGITMQIWQESQRDPRHAGCCSLGAVEDARRVARILDVPHYVMNFKSEFKKEVIDEFIEEYSQGRTPNPCVTCNKSVKFEALMAKMRELGCDKLATGHYARIRRSSRSGHYRLMRSRGGTKDQSYVLYMLDQDQLASVMFPLGEFDGKAETRRMAQEMGLPVALKPDSQEICFVSEAGGYVEFLRSQRPELFRPGEILDEDGRAVGQHQGVAGFTVGQRKGIGLTARHGRALYVLKIIPNTNQVVVGQQEELLQRDVALREVHWSGPSLELGQMRVMAKIRYNMPAERAVLIANGGTMIRFDRPVRAVTPGQIAVAYRGETVVVGGKIV